MKIGHIDSSSCTLFFLRKVQKPAISARRCFSKAQQLSKYINKSNLPDTVLLLNSLCPYFYTFILLTSCWHQAVYQVWCFVSGDITRLGFPETWLYGPKRCPRQCRPGSFSSPEHSAAQFDLQVHTLSMKLCKFILHIANFWRLRNCLMSQYWFILYIKQQTCHRKKKKIEQKTTKPEEFHHLTCYAQLSKALSTLSIDSF